MRAFEFIDRWIFETYRPCVKGLPYYRVLFAFYLLVFHFPAYGWIGAMPQAFYHPSLSLAALCPTLPPAWFFFGIDFVLELGAVCLLVGRWTRPVSFLLCAGVIIGNSFCYAIGPKIDHDILVPATLFCLGFSGWGECFSWDERQSLI